ncbi:MAG: glycosyltransferase family 9 protein [Bacteroidales bacterium]|nr:glycosyltransferase family 9 protein [Bacteroidales bacterium]
MNKFLIIQTASIGDVILATPVLEKLHHFFPEAKIDILLKAGNENLFNDHPFLNNVLIWNKSGKKYRNFINIIKTIRKRNYDYVINIQRFASSGLITFMSGAKNKIGFNKNPFSLFFSKRIKHTIKSGNKHESERNLELIRSITDSTSFPVKIYPSKKDYDSMSQYKTIQYLCIAPASLWFTKQYPIKKWVEFISEIDNAYKIYFLGSKNDYKICEEIIKTSKHSNSLNLAGKLNFLESAALMKDAKMNYVNDSAPLHIASAVNAPVTAIYCSTVPEFGFGPLSDNSTVVQTKENLSCRPCGIHGFNSCPEKHFKCAFTIKKEELLKKISK